ncbi:CDP-glucose 4,6-dehydratase [Pararhodospirillum photometricum]|nr:CDP-glucose 4,6-dehydratase [Pararhodospirillum photometricum]
MVTPPTPAFWRGKRVLVTGHTGFKGGWLTLWLHTLGARITALALPPQTTPSLFELARVAAVCESHFLDIREAQAVAERIRAARPEIVLHLAAQPLVRASYRDPVETFASNVMGTAHVLEALRGLDGVRVAVMITTDKVYHNKEWPHPYRETDRLGGHDPYSASKAAAEVVIACYRDAFLTAQGVAVASARAGNVIGGGDWSADRLIPDAVRAWEAGRVLEVRRPQATRPWQHVLEPLAGYLSLAEHLWAHPEAASAYNFGPLPHEAATVRTVIEQARVFFGRGEAAYGDGRDGPHEAGLLALDVAKAQTVLGFTPRWSLEQTLQRTLGWYRALSEGTAARDLCEADLAAYSAGGPP